MKEKLSENFLKFSDSLILTFLEIFDIIYVEKVEKGLYHKKYFI